MNFYIGIDIGGTKIAIGIVDQNGNILNFTKIPTDLNSSYSENIQKIVHVCNKLIENDFTDKNLKAVGIACPGPIDSEKGIIINPANLPSWSSMNIVKDLQAIINVPVFLEHDVGASALAENWIGVAKNLANIIYITISTGISAGLMLNKKIYRGSFQSAGEFGHTIIKPYGRKCQCGSYGCLEEYACGRSLPVRAEEIILNYKTYGPSYLYKEFINVYNLISNHCKDSGDTFTALKNFNKLEKSITNGAIAQMLKKSSNITAKEIGRLAESGDPFSLLLYQELSFYLGLSLVNLISLLDPQAIILGGGLMKSWDICYPIILNTIKKFLKQVPYNRNKILKAKLGEKVGVIGAARVSMLKV